MFSIKLNIVVVNLFAQACYDGNHKNGIIDLTDKGIGVIQSLL